MTTESSQVRRLLHTVAHEGVLETRRIRNARITVISMMCVVAVLLGIDYKAAFILFSYLDPTLDGTSVGPAFLALTVPVGVVAIHLLIKDKNGGLIEDRLQKLAGIGVFIFFAGVAMLLSLVYFDASEGIGSGATSTIQGSIGNDDLGIGPTQTSPLLSGFGSILSGLSPVLFFAGMTFILFVTVYACHQFMKRIEARFDTAFNSTNRAKELRGLCDEADAMMVDIAKREAAIATARKKLPGDPEYAFCQLASSALGDALLRMKKALRSLDHSKRLSMIPVRATVEIPEEVETRAQGKQIIADICQATTPYAILKELDGLPPQEEDS
ncbi:MAG: hypothetical protein ACE360_11340 [Hyphomicrobiales bacterium]